MDIVNNMMTRAQIAEAGGVVTLTLNPPEGKPPTIDPALFDQMEAWFDALAKAPGEVCLEKAGIDGTQTLTCRPRLLIVRSAVDRWFCAGANISVLQTTTESSIGPWVRRGNEVFQKLATLPIPTIARVQGYALGGGLELALACDLIVAGEEAVMGQTEAKLGFIPGWGASGRLPARVGESKAKYLFFTGAMVDATSALSMGLVDQVATGESLDESIADLVSAMEANSPVAIAAFKRILASTPSDWRAVMEAEAKESVDCVASAETQSRLHAFLNRRKPAKS